MKVLLRLCYLCWDDGEEIPATYSYYAKAAQDWFDICDEHKKETEKLGFEIIEIKENPQEVE